MQAHRLVAAGGAVTVVLGTAGAPTAGASPADETATRAAEQSIEGTRGDDHLVGTARRDVIRARAGNDDARGRGRFDRIYGGAGSDTLRGGRANDRLYGGRGNDLVYTNEAAENGDRADGGPGKDRIFGSRGIDHVYDGSGRDAIKTRRGDDDIGLAHDGVRDLVRCGAGHDVVIYNFSVGNDRLRGCEEVTFVD